MRYLSTAAAAVAALALAAAGGLAAYRAGGEWWHVAAYVAACALFFPLSAQLHELGHKLFGAFAGMRVKLGRFAVFAPSVCTVTPCRSKNIRRAFIATACGGLAVNFLLAAAGAALLFFGNGAVYASFVAPSSLYLLIVNAAPSGDGACATDMDMLLDAAKNTPQWQVLERVLTVQGMLAEGTPIEALDEELLFSVPQIAEDRPAFIMLVCLRAEYYASKNDLVNAEKWRQRYEQLKNDYL